MTKYAKCSECGYVIAIPDDKNASDYVCPNDGNTLTNATEAEFTAHLGGYNYLVEKLDSGGYRVVDHEGSVVFLESDPNHAENAILYAINNLPSEGGKITLLPATYKLNFYITKSEFLITLPDHTVFDGLVRGSTTLEFYIDGDTPPDHFNAMCLTSGSNCVIKNLTIDGKPSFFQPKNYLEYLIWCADDKENILIENVNILNSSRCGIVPESENMIIRNVYAENCQNAMDGGQMKHIEVDGYRAKSCTNAFFKESHGGNGSNIILRNFRFEDCFTGFYAMAHLENVVVEEGKIELKGDYGSKGFHAAETNKAFTIKNVEIVTGTHGAAFYVRGEEIGDVVISNCYCDGYQAFWNTHDCIIDGGNYSASYVFTVSAGNLLVKNAHLENTYRMFFDNVTNIHLENCILNSIASDGTESNITYRRCTIADLPTENSGTATIPNGSSNVTVNHGLAKAPEHGVRLTGTHSEVANCWVTNVTDTQFTINAPANVTADRDVYWEAKV